MNTKRPPAPEGFQRPDVAPLLADARLLRPRPDSADAALWERIADGTVRTPTHRPIRLIVLATAATLATAALAFFLLRAPPDPARGHLVELASDIHLEPSADAVLGSLTSRSEAATVVREVTLTAGAVRAEVGHQSADSQFALVTPHLRVVVVGTRFTVEVLQDVSRVRVLEGRVRVEAHGRVVQVAAGEGVGSDDPRLAPAPAAPPGPTLSTCEAATAEPERIACLERLAAGDGLVAENAFYLLGLARERQDDAQGALSRWQDLIRRFPNGALGPETHLSALRAAMKLRQFEQALALADAFRQRFADDTRLPEVLLIRAKLLCAHQRHGSAALEAFEQVQALETTSAEVRQEALFAAGECQSSLGDPAGARRIFELYLRRFPEGAHVADAQRRLKRP